MLSMTGYGKGTASKQGLSYTVEIKTVNHKSIDWGLKLPRNLIFLEDSVKKTVQKYVTRGHIDIFITFEKGADAQTDVNVDLSLASAYVHAARLIMQETGIEKDITVSDIISMPDVISKASGDDDELIKELVLSALEEALKNLIVMRKKEGEALKLDLKTKLDTMSGYLDIIKERAPLVVEDYKAKLQERIAELCAPQNVDEARLATEVALFADHCSIDEEITRLSMHIKHVNELLEDTKPVGRNIDFLVQEFIRETNTIGSKANDLTITTQVLALKNEIEKIREQACNIE